MICFEKKQDAPGPYYFHGEETYRTLGDAIRAAYPIVHAFGYGQSIDILSAKGDVVVGTMYRGSEQYGERRVKAGLAVEVHKGRILSAPRKRIHRHRG